MDKPHKQDLELASIAPQVSTGVSTGPMLRGSLLVMQPAPQDQISTESQKMPALLPIQVFSRFNSFFDCVPQVQLLVFATFYFRCRQGGLERVFELRSTFQIAAVNMSLGGGQYSPALAMLKARSPVSFKTYVQSNIASAIASGNDGFTNGDGASLRAFPRPSASATRRRPMW